MAFEHEHIDKVLTVEASGIHISCATALVFDVPLTGHNPK
jgi:adenine/guanine phosphoribosyltransferase-like PRPP-binding protein